LIFKNKKIELRLSEKHLDLEEKNVLTKNPFSDKDTKINPLSFSVFFKNRIIVPFEPGTFACYDLSI
jgi:hypothetical protein